MSEPAVHRLGRESLPAGDRAVTMRSGGGAAPLKLGDRGGDHPTGPGLIAGSRQRATGRPCHRATPVPARKPRPLPGGPGRIALTRARHGSHVDHRRHLDDPGAGFVPHRARRARGKNSVSAPSGQADRIGSGKAAVSQPHRRHAPPRRAGSGRPAAPQGRLRSGAPPPSWPCRCSSHHSKAGKCPTGHTGGASTRSAWSSRLGSSCKNRKNTGVTVVSCFIRSPPNVRNGIRPPAPDAGRSAARVGALTFIIPVKAGIHASQSAMPARWTPAFAGGAVEVWRRGRQ